MVRTDDRTVASGPAGVSTPPTGLSAGDRAHHAVSVLRLLFGTVFLANGLAKVLPGIWNTPLGFLINTDHARQILASEAARHPVSLYRAFVEDVIVRNWSLVGPLLAGFEIILGALLLAGVATRVTAAVGAAFALHLHALTLFNGRWLFEYALLWVPLLLVAYAAEPPRRGARAGPPVSHRLAEPERTELEARP